MELGRQRFNRAGERGNKKTTLIGDAEISAGFIHRVKNCYPVYNCGYKEKLKPIENYLSSIENLSVIGRYGAFKYNNQDHSILMGILAAENIAQNANNNLWEINTDYEYQESAKIGKTGLEKPQLIPQEAVIPQHVFVKNLAGKSKEVMPQSQTVTNN